MRASLQLLGHHDLILGLLLKIVQDIHPLVSFTMLKHPEFQKIPCLVTIEERSPNLNGFFHSGEFGPMTTYMRSPIVPVNPIKILRSASDDHDAGDNGCQIRPAGTTRVSGVC